MVPCNNYNVLLNILIILNVVIYHNLNVVVDNHVLFEW